MEPVFRLLSNDSISTAGDRPEEADDSSDDELLDAYSKALATSVCAASSQGEQAMPGFFFAGGDRSHAEMTEDQRERRMEEQRELMDKAMERWLTGD